MTVIASRPYLTKDERARYAETFGGRPALDRYCENCGMLPAWCECVPIPPHLQRALAAAVSNLDTRPVATGDYVFFQGDRANR